MYAILFIALLGLSSTGASVAQRCDGSPTQLGENIPVNTTDKAHSVAHAASVTMDGEKVAWLYQDQNGSLWFQANGSAKVSEPDVERASALFGLHGTDSRSLRNYILRVTRQATLVGLSGRTVLDRGCF